MKLSKSLISAAFSIALLSTTAQAQDNFPTTSFNPGYFPTSTPFTLWNGAYEKTNMEVVVGYVNKSWRCTYDSGTQREDFFGDPDDKFIHGIQVGVVYTPSFDWGLGLRTGLFLESYISRSKWITAFCNSFVEGDMYIPLHASYRIPFDDEIGLNFYGGLGFQWAMQGRYQRIVGTVWPGGWWWRRPVPLVQTRNHEYGNGGPKRVNWQAECGVNFRLKNIAFNFTYSFGIVDHGIENTFDGGQSYVLAKKSRQDKMQASIMFTF